MTTINHLEGIRGKVFAEFWKQDKADELVPRHIHRGLCLWICAGIEPGDFLQALLKNDLKETFARADDINKHAVLSIVTYMYNYAPIGAWGGEKRYEEWRAWFAEQNAPRPNTDETATGAEVHP